MIYNKHIYSLRVLLIQNEPQEDKHKYRLYFTRLFCKGRRGRDHMVVRFTTTYAISAYHH
jgi:hypothetical protein